MKCDGKKKYEADALACERLQETVEPLVEWFRENQRDLPWRKHVNAYRVQRLCCSRREWKQLNLIIHDF